MNGLRDECELALAALAARISVPQRLTCLAAAPYATSPAGGAPPLAAKGSLVFLDAVTRGVYLSQAPQSS